MNSTIPLSTTPDITPLQDRLVTLSDGRPGVRGALSVETRVPAAPSAESAPGLPVIDFIASSETLDRYGEIILASGWRLENYLRNPVFQNAHQYGDVLFTLGKALITEVRSGPIPTADATPTQQALAAQDNPPNAAQDTPSPLAFSPQPSAFLFQRVQFATDVNPIAKIAYGLYRDRFLNAVSVGFIPLRWEEGGPEAGFRRRYLEQELLEVSAVGLPANPEALQLALKAGALHKSDLQELLDFLRQFSGHHSGGSSAFGRRTTPPGIPDRSAVAGAAAPWLRLALELRRILRGA